MVIFSLAQTSVGSLAASPLVVDVSKKCEPLLQKADQFGCYQLEQVTCIQLAPLQVNSTSLTKRNETGRNKAVQASRPDVRFCQPSHLLKQEGARGESGGQQEGCRTCPSTCFPLVKKTKSNRKRKRKNRKMKLTPTLPFTQGNRRPAHRYHLSAPGFPSCCAHQPSLGLC